MGSAALAPGRRMMGEWIAVVGWDEYQHRDAARAGKALPWVKLPVRLQREDGPAELSPARFGIFCRLLLEYAQSACRLRAESAQLSRRLNARVRQDDLEALEQAGLIRICASIELAWCWHDASIARAIEKEIESKPKAVTPVVGERPGENSQETEVTSPEKEAAEAVERFRARITREIPF